MIKKNRKGAFAFPSRIPNRLRCWIALFISAHIAVLVLSMNDISLATAIFWSYWYSESSIGFWMSMGLPPHKSIAIAWMGSAAATTNWLWFANCVDLKLIRAVLGTIIKAISRNNRPRFRKPAARLLAKKLLPVLRKYRDANINPPERIRRSPYLFLPILAFFPDGGVFVAISYVMLFRLNQSVSLSLLMIGNLVKVTAWGYVFNFAAYSFGKTSLKTVAIVIVITAAVFSLKKFFKQKK